MKRPKKPEQFAAAALKRLESASRSKSKCKICAHSLRDDIDELLIAGVKGNAILKFAGERGLKITNSGLSRHRNNHLRVSESEAREALDDADTAVRKVLTKLVRELKRRSLEDLSTKQIAIYTQAALEVSLALRSSPPNR